MKKRFQHVDANSPATLFLLFPYPVTRVVMQATFLVTIPSQSRKMVKQSTWASLPKDSFRSEVTKTTPLNSGQAYFEFTHL